MCVWLLEFDGGFKHLFAFLLPPSFLVVDTHVSVQEVI